MRRGSPLLFLAFLFTGGDADLNGLRGDTFCGDGDNGGSCGGIVLDVTEFAVLLVVITAFEDSARGEDGGSEESEDDGGTHFYRFGFPKIGRLKDLYETSVSVSESGLMVKKRATTGL